eukprot:GHVP01033272.1.p1 GENE.GHVP01033272.1~~GHVP01033272.1.p1  ORF type:complete len:836 (-),score=123.83 GHVP01033272.1:230-2737(-)
MIRLQKNQSRKTSVKRQEVLNPRYHSVEGKIHSFVERPNKCCISVDAFRKFTLGNSWESPEDVCLVLYPSGGSKCSFALREVHTVSKGVLGPVAELSILDTVAKTLGLPQNCGVFTARAIFRRVSAFSLSYAEVQLHSTNLSRADLYDLQEALQGTSIFTGVATDPSRFDCNAGLLGRKPRQKTNFVSHWLGISNFTDYTEDIFYSSKSAASSSSSSSTPELRNSFDSISNLQKSDLKFVGNGIVRPDTLLVLRSKIQQIIILIQISEEMWWLSKENTLYFFRLEKFLEDCLLRWEKDNANHHITFVMFHRLVVSPLFPEKKFEKKDFFSILWEGKCRNLKFERNQFFDKLREEFIKFPEQHKWRIPSFAGIPNKHETDSRVNLSLAASGNFLEALNMAFSFLDLHYIDKSFEEMGQAVMVVTAGNGVIWSLNNNILELTKLRIMENVSGPDIVSLRDMEASDRNDCIVLCHFSSTNESENTLMAPERLEEARYLVVHRYEELPHRENNSDTNSQFVCCAVRGAFLPPEDAENISSGSSDSTIQPWWRFLSGNDANSQLSEPVILHNDFERLMISSPDRRENIDIVMEEAIKQKWLHVNTFLYKNPNVHWDSLLFPAILPLQSAATLRLSDGDYLVLTGHWQITAAPELISYFRKDCDKVSPSGPFLIRYLIRQLLFGRLLQGWQIIPEVQQLKLNLPILLSGHFEALGIRSEKFVIQQRNKIFRITSEEEDLNIIVESFYHAKKEYDLKTKDLRKIPNLFPNMRSLTNRPEYEYEYFLRDIKKSSWTLVSTTFKTKFYLGKQIYQIYLKMKYMKFVVVFFAFISASFQNNNLIS